MSIAPITKQKNLQINLVSDQSALSDKKSSMFNQFDEATIEQNFSSIELDFKNEAQNPKPHPGDEISSFRILKFK